MVEFVIGIVVGIVLAIIAGLAWAIKNLVPPL